MGLSFGPSKPAVPRHRLVGRNWLEALRLGTTQPFDESQLTAIGQRVFFGPTTRTLARDKHLDVQVSRMRRLVAPRSRSEVRCVRSRYADADWPIATLHFANLRLE